MHEKINETIIDKAVRVVNRQKRAVKIYNIVSFSILFFLSCICILFGLNAVDYVDLKLHVVNISLDIFCMFICDLLLLNLLSEGYFNKRCNTMIAFISAVGYALFFDYLAWIVDDVAKYSTINMIVNSMYYIMGYFVLICYWFYIQMEFEVDIKKTFVANVISQIMIIIGIVLTLLNIPYGFLFTVVDGVYARSPYNMIAIFPPLVILCVIIFLIIAIKMSPGEKYSLLSYLIFPLLGLFVQQRHYGVSLIYPGVVLSVIMIYNNVYLMRGKKIVEQKKELAQKNVAIMISQIQPHFLYNSLTTISNLCRKDPEAAEEATVMFSQYLRMNLDSVKKMEPVHFTKELEHVKIYLELEKKRFREKLSVEYDIQVTNFKIPALSIQPIVENSVKHGICEKEEPGLLKISTYSDEKQNVIVIQDDGVGFDPLEPRVDDGRSHVGMDNVKDRLKEMCNAKMEVISAPGEGCITKIYVPIEKE